MKKMSCCPLRLDKNYECFVRLKKKGEKTENVKLLIRQIILTQTHFF